MASQIKGLPYLSFTRALRLINDKNKPEQDTVAVYVPLHKSKALLAWDMSLLKAIAEGHLSKEEAEKLPRYSRNEIKDLLTVLEP